MNFSMLLQESCHQTIYFALIFSIASLRHLVKKAGRGHLPFARSDWGSQSESGLLQLQLARGEHDPRVRVPGLEKLSAGN